MEKSKDRAGYYRDIYNARVKDIEKNRLEVIVHGYMLYCCEDCGFEIKMYLERGLEDRVEYEKTGKHKPVPFIIGCPKCGGFMRHIAWDVGRSDIYTFFTPHDGDGYAGLFADFDAECGLPVIFGLPETEEKVVATGMNRAERRLAAKGRTEAWEANRWHRERSNGK